METINIPKLKKQAKSSWKADFEGKEMLGHLPEVSLVELPYYAFRFQIERYENLSTKLKNDSFRYPMMQFLLLEAKLMFIFRYEWEFGKTALPFGYNWIHKQYRELSGERDLSNFLLN